MSARDQGLMIAVFAFLMTLHTAYGCEYAGEQPQRSVQSRHEARCTSLPSRLTSHKRARGLEPSGVTLHVVYEQQAGYRFFSLRYRCMKSSSVWSREYKAGNTGAFRREGKIVPLGFSCALLHVHLRELGGRQLCVQSRKTQHSREFSRTLLLHVFPLKEGGYCTCIPSHS